MERQSAAHARPTGARMHRLLGVEQHQPPEVLNGGATQRALDRVTTLVGDALAVTAVCASLVDADGRLVASSYGLPVPTALLISHAFREHVMASRRPLVADDARNHPLVANNPAVRDGLVRACVGMPLRRPGGRGIGTLLAMDQRARAWTPLELDLLERVAAMIVDEIELGVAVRRVLSADAHAVPVPEWQDVVAQ